MRVLKPVKRLSVVSLVLLSSLAGTSVVAQTPTGLPFTETFDFDNLKDAGSTTADWSTVLGVVQLPSANPLSNTFDGLTLAENLPEAHVTRALALGDLDGDGDLDLVDGVLGRSGVLLNDGTGDFGPARVYTSTSYSNTRSVAIGDLDVDGDLDWVAGNFGGRPRLYLNDGSGASFSESDVSPLRAQTNGIALADFNGDGYLDVVIANENNTVNSIYYNTQDPLTPFGPFGALRRPVGSATEDTRAVVAGDLDADGDIDLVFLNDGQGNRVHINQGTNSAGAIFSAGTLIGTDTDSSVGGALGDMNGDGFLDLVVANSTPGQVSKIYLNSALGAGFDPFTGTVSVAFTAPNDPDEARAVNLGDADNDGDLDIFLTSVATNGNGGSRLYLNDGTGVVYTRTDIGVEQESTRAAAVGDVDGDGDLDFIAGNQTFANSVTGPELNRLYRNAGSDAGGPAVLQLSAHAASLEVDNLASDIVSVRLTRTVTSTGPQFANDIEFWLSNDGGSRWVRARPGRPVAFATTGAELEWRAVFASLSPFTASAMALDTLFLAVNSGPVVTTPLGSQSATQGTPFSVLADIDDTDTPPDVLVYSLSGLPVGTGLAIDPRTGEIAGTPTNADAVASSASSGLALTVTASDGGLRATDPFVLTVANVNDAPFITTPPVISVASGALYAYAISATDPDPGVSALTLTAGGALPAWLSLVDNGNGTGTLSGTPQSTDVGVHSVSLTVTDEALASGTQSFTISVANDPPSFSSAPQTAALQGLVYIYDVTATDPTPGDTLTITAQTSPPWLVLTPNTAGNGTARLHGTPEQADVGDHTVELRVSDTSGGFAVQSFTITVDEVNLAPVFTSVPLTTATEAAIYSYQVASVDGDGDPIALTISGGPSWLSLQNVSNGNAELIGTPRGNHIGSHSIELVAEDPFGGTARQQFTINVSGAPGGPVITVNGTTTVSIEQGRTYTDAGATAQDAQDGNLTSQIVVTNPVNTNASGSYTVTYTVQDTAGNVAQAQRTVVVQAPSGSGGGTGGGGSIDILLLVALLTVALAAREKESRAL